MNWRFINYCTSLILFSGLFLGCNQSDYTKMVKQETAKGVRYDSLLLGFKFGNSSDEFYGKCYDLNQQHLVTQGPSGTSVRYKFKDSLVHNEPTEIQMLFSPTFDDQDKIIEMNLQLSYMSFFPGNKEYEADSLKAKTMQLLLKWYEGNEFVTAHVNEKDLPVKLDGNRRILIYNADKQSVIVQIQDIFHPKFKHSTMK